MQRRRHCRSATGRARRVALLTFAWAAGAGLLLALEACSPEARYRVARTVFDGVPPPGTPRPERRRRQTVRVEPRGGPGSGDQVEGQSLEDIGVGITGPKPEPWPGWATYAELAAALPKDAVGDPNWMAAARMGVIKPRPGPDPEAEEFPELPFDIILKAPVPGFDVTFPHAAHTYWLRCDSCHPAIFRMKAGSNPITMAKVLQGEYCGRCHGKVAFKPETSCSRCHLRLGASAQ